MRTNVYRARAESCARIVVVCNIVPEYRRPILERLADDRRYELIVVTTRPLHESSPAARKSLRLVHSPAGNVWLSTRHRGADTVQREPFALPWRLATDLVRLRPSAIITGDWGLQTLFARIASRHLGVPHLLWNEDVASSAAGRGRLRARVREYVSRRMDAFIAWGEPAAEYVLGLGARSDRVFVCAQAIDNETWIDWADQLDRRAVRQELGIAGETTFLFVGRLLPSKGCSELVEAWRAVPEPLRRRSRLLIVGEGELAESLRAAASTVPSGEIRCLGRRDGVELAKAYAAADVLVVPSRIDVWGLVVNEALAFGMPVIGSRYAGAVQYFSRRCPLVTPFEAASVEALTRELVRHATTPRERDVRAGRRAIAPLTFDSSALAIRDAIDSCVV